MKVHPIKILLISLLSPLTLWSYPSNSQEQTPTLPSATPTEPTTIDTSPAPAPTPTEPTTSETPARKLRIAVLDFDFSSVSNPSFLSVFPGQSKGVSDMLVNKLVETGDFIVIERSRIDAVLAEQNLGASGRVDASTAAEIGRILGVDVVVVGSITQFDLQRRSSGGGAFGIGANVQKEEAYVQLNVRVVNTTTAEIMATAEGEGTANQSDSQVRVFGIGGGSSTDNTTKLLSLATEEAITQVIDSVRNQRSQMAATPRALPTAQAVVSFVDGSRVILNKGSQDGYRVGMKLSIERVTQEVKDPETGAVIHQLTSPIAEVEITEVDNDSCVGTIVSGSQLTIGDVAQPIQ